MPEHRSAMTAHAAPLPANLGSATRPFLPFALPDIGEDEIREVVDSLRSGWLTTGPKTRQFESDFSTFLGDGVEALAVNSATAGLHLALEAVGIGPGDEVITTTHTFTATAEVVRYLGADVKLVDIDPATLNIDPVAIEDRKSTRLNSSHTVISYAVFCLKKKKQKNPRVKTLNAVKSRGRSEGTKLLLQGLYHPPTPIAYTINPR